MSAHNICFLWRNKKNMNTFLAEKNALFWAMIKKENFNFHYFSRMPVLWAMVIPIWLSLNVQVFEKGNVLLSFLYEVNSVSNNLRNGTLWHIWAAMALIGLSIGIVQGPVVQSVVSSTCSLRVISLTVLAGSIHNILIFFAEKCE